MRVSLEFNSRRIRDFTLFATVRADGAGSCFLTPNSQPTAQQQNAMSYTTSANFGTPRGSCKSL
jgi:hypothetical protein